MSEHTATPWQFTHDHRNNLFEIETVDQGDGYRHFTNNMPMIDGGPRAACGCGENCLANAAFIVRAVNAHDALVEALREALDYIGSNSSGAVQDQIRAALKLAEGNACTCPTPDFHAINCPAHDDAAHWANR